MLRTILVVTALAVFVAGCTSPQEKAAQEIEQATQACRAAWPGGPSVDRANCLNQADKAYFLKYLPAHMDLAELKRAYRLALSERFEAGQIAMTEAEVQWAELMSRVTTELQRRQYAAAQNQAARATAYANMLQGLAVWQQAQQRQTQQLLQPQQPSLGAGGSITCWDYGAFVRCQ